MKGYMVVKNYYDDYEVDRVYLNEKKAEKRAEYKNGNSDDGDGYWSVCEIEIVE